MGDVDESVLYFDEGLRPEAEESLLLKKLPGHVQLLIFQFLPVGDLAVCARVCRHFRALAMDSRCELGKVQRIREQIGSLDSRCALEAIRKTTRGRIRIVAPSRPRRAAPPRAPPPLANGIWRRLLTTSIARAIVFPLDTVRLYRQLTDVPGSDLRVVQCVWAAWVDVSSDGAVSNKLQSCCVQQATVLLQSCCVQQATVLLCPTSYSPVVSNKLQSCVSNMLQSCCVQQKLQSCCVQQATVLLQSCCVQHAAVLLCPTSYSPAVSNNYSPVVSNKLQSCVSNKLQSCCVQQLQSCCVQQATDLEYSAVHTWHPAGWAYFMVRAWRGFFVRTRGTWSVSYTRDLLAMSRALCSAHSLQYGGMFATMRGLFRDHGVAAFYRGHTTTLLKVPPTQLTVTLVRNALRSLAGRVNRDFFYLFVHSTGGAVVGLGSYPLDIARQALVGDPGGRKYRGVWQALKHGVNKRGLRGMYSGFWLSIVGLSLYKFVYLLIYETFRPRGFFLLNMSATLAGWCVQPIDTLKRRTMCDASVSPWRTLLHILKNGKSSQLFTGAIENTVRTWLFTFVHMFIARLI